MNLIRHLRECTSIQDAAPILSKLEAGPGIRKLVETSIILSNSSDPQQRDHAFSFMDKAIQEILDNHNNGDREDGSEQSSDNEEPYPNVSKISQSGENSMMNMQGVTNQMNGSHNAFPVQGLDPTIANEMGMGIPGMNGSQMARQMQYTANKAAEELYKKIIPLQKMISQNGKAIKELSIELTKNKTRRNSLDLAIRETTRSLTTQTNIQIDNQRIPHTPIPQNKYWQPLIDIRPHKGPTLEQIRNEISSQDKSLRQS